MTHWYPDHGVGVWMRVGDGPEVLVGTAREMDDVPALLRAIADRWSAHDGGRHLLVVDNDDDDVCGP